MPVPTMNSILAGLHFFSTHTLDWPVSRAGWRASGFVPRGQRWTSSLPAFLLPVRVLGALFRRLFLTRPATVPRCRQAHPLRQRGAPHWRPAICTTGPRSRGFHRIRHYGLIAGTALQAQPRARPRAADARPAARGPRIPGAEVNICAGCPRSRPSSPAPAYRLAPEPLISR